jgi:hypothetical protein
MPFTPLHMGPGMLLKVVLRTSFSLVIFGWVQILIDIQPLWGMIKGQGQLHGVTHTYLGAVFIGLIGALSGKYVAIGIFKWLKPTWVKVSSIRWRVAFVSAYLGSFSHVFLDSFMHADLQPFFPWRLDNPFVNQISIDLLNILCIFAGVIGLVIYGVVLRLNPSFLSTDDQRN